MNKICDFIKKHKKAITNIITVVVLFLMVYYLYKNREVFFSLKNLDLKYVIYVSIIQIVAIFFIALTNKKVIAILGHNIPLGEAFLLQYANSFLNKIVSEGGALFRGVFLKEIYKLPYTKYISTIAGLYIINFLTNSILGLISLGYISFTYHRTSYLVLMFFIIIILAMMVLIFVSPRFKNKKENRVLKWINSILDGWREIKRNKQKLVTFSLLAIASLFFVSLQSIFVYRGLGFELGFFESLYMSSLGMITTFVNITPDSVGIREGVYMFSSDIIGLDSDIILLGSLIIRAIGLINTFVLGGISYLKLAPRLKEKNYLEKDSKEI
jgi:uncharacterized membrane protein YbhN (UPF0104 family)